ncbi:MAG: hypothetical protein AMXMBFR47_05110 [Planctomycetota bacterium]
MAVIYVETTVWSFAFADDSPDYTADTLRFFDRCRSGEYETRISGVVVEEIARAPANRRVAMEALIAEIGSSIIPASPEADELAAAFVRLGAVPPSKPSDAAHVATAFVGQCDVLVSWNFRHIANVRRTEKFNAIAVLWGYTNGMTIVSPAEVQYGNDQA